MKTNKNNLLKSTFFMFFLFNLSNTTTFAQSDLVDKNLSKFNLIEATKLKRDIKEKNTNSEQAANNLADLLVNAGYNVRALAELEKYITKNDSLSFEIRLRVAQMYRDALDYPKALEHISILEKMRPRNTDILLLKGSILVETGQFSKAVESLSVESTSIETNSDAVGYRSFALNGLKKYKESLDLTKSVLYINKFNPLSLLGRAESYLGLGNKEEAIKSLDLLVKNKNLTPYLLVKAGKFYRAANSLRASKDYYVRALELQPDRAETAIELAKTYYDLEEYNLSKNVLESTLAKQPDNDRVIFHLVKVYTQNGEIDLAGKIIGKYWNEFPTQAWAAAAYAKALTLSGNTDKALEVLNKTISITEDSSEAFVTAGDILLGLEKFKDSLEILHKGETKFKKDSAIKAELGKVYLALGDTEKSLYWNNASKAISEKTSREPATINSIDEFKEKLLE